jgi:hypothetical protein
MFNWSDYQNIVNFPPPSDVPRISMLIFKCNISRVDRGKRGEEVFMTVINLAPGQSHDSILVVGVGLALENGESAGGF